MPHEPALQSRGGTSHAMGSGCVDIITSLLKCHCLLCVHIAHCCCIWVVCQGLPQGTDPRAEIPFHVRAAVRWGFQCVSGNDGDEQQQGDAEAVPGTSVCLSVFLLWPWCPWRCGGGIVSQWSSEDTVNGLCILSTVVLSWGWGERCLHCGIGFLWGNSVCSMAQKDLKWKGVWGWKPWRISLLFARLVFMIMALGIIN